MLSCSWMNRRCVLPAVPAVHAALWSPTREAGVVLLIDLQVCAMRAI